MLKLPKLSGQEIVKILVKEFGFEISRQRGSHVVLRKMEKGKKIVTIVPLHEEVKPGTLLGILRLARIRKEEFLEKLK
ncbi:MAG: type II toxin-antitoxin system HicA family toxin [Nitrososphaeria archaeon]